MAAFDLTTNPPNQTIEAGSTAKITVVVSNRLGKPVMARVDGVVTPPQAAAWLKGPAEPQRRFEADAAATLTFDFTVAVPAGTPPAAIQFRATVVDVLAPDDNRAEGQTVSVDVAAKAVVDPGGGGGGVPWWVWVIAAVVLLGAGFGIYKLVSKPKGVPNVIGKSASEAERILTDKGYAPVTVKDTIDPEAKDTVVVSQVPEPRSDLPVDSLKGKTPAVVVVNRPPTTVPAIVGQPLALAIERLREAGLRVGTNAGRYTPNVTQDDQIAGVDPAAGAVVPTGSAVNLVIFAFSDQPPCARPQLCVVGVKPRWTEMTRAKTRNP